MARRFAPTCARAALGVGLWGAQEPAHSEPSAPISVNHKTSHITGGRINGIHPNAARCPFSLGITLVGGIDPARYVGSWEVSHKSVGNALKPGPAHRARAARRSQSRRC